MWGAGKNGALRMSLAFFRRGDADRAGGGDRRPQRPKIGIALGAGVARGWAHIGVLRELEAMGVRPDVIAGASIGAVVGGCFAAGKLDALETFARSLTKRSVFNLLDVSFSGSGLIGGDRLRGRLEAALAAQRIEETGIRFVAVATEIGAGHEIWLKSGSIVEAMCASYALPGVFEPVRIGGRWLFDGAIVKPVPVSVARAMGADRVIAVCVAAENGAHGAVMHDAQAPARCAPEPEPVALDSTGRLLDGLRRSLWTRHAWTHRENEPPGLAAVMVNTFNITQDRIMRSRLAGDPPDMMLTLKTGKFGLFEFHRADELIEVGRATVRRAKDEILEHLEPASA